MANEHAQRSKIKQLIRQLNVQETNVGQNANWTLASMGPVVIEPLLKAMSSLHLNGRIEAVDCLAQFNTAQLRKVPALLYTNSKN